MSDTSKAAMRALEDFTPGGSEYVGDVARCVEFIKWRQSSQHERIVKLTKQLRATEERDKLARELAELCADRFAPFGDLGNHEAGCGYWWKTPRKSEGNCTCGSRPIYTKARQLLKLYEEDGGPSTLPGG